jgi:non-heme chloroperoxidase
MPYIETDGTRLYYRDIGAGRPVLFVHGWAVGGDMWEYQTQFLVDHGFRCITYDQRGCGRSDDPGRGYDYNTLSDDLAALIDRLDLRQTMLVGHSMGCGVIIRYAARHGSSKIARTVLACTTTPFILKTPDNPDGFDIVAIESVVNSMKEDRADYVTRLADPFFGEGLPECAVSEPMKRWAIDLAMTATINASVELQRTNLLTDQREDLASVDVPTLIIHGDSDPGCPLELTARRTADGIRNSRLIVYKNGPHGLVLTHRKQFNKDLLAFMD